MDDVEGLKQLKYKDGGPAEQKDQHNHGQHWNNLKHPN